MLAGLGRVSLNELAPDEFPYRRAAATMLQDRAPDADLVGTMKVALLSTVADLIEKVKHRNPRFSMRIPDDIPPSLLADQLADALISEPAERQRILEQLDVKVRLALVQDAVASQILRITGTKPTFN